MPSTFFHQLHLSLIYEIDAFENRLNELRAGDYPTSAADSLITYLIGDLEQQRVRIGKIVNDLPSDPRGAFDRLSSEHRKLIYQLPLLVNLENSQTRRVPWSFVPSIEALAQLLLEEYVVLTSTDAELNYSITWTRKPASNKKPYAVLFVPAIHRIDAFLHVLIGHELFHPVLDAFLENQQSAVLSQLRGLCQQHLKGQPSIVPLFEKQRLDRMIETVRFIWRRALEELMCDMGGAAIFGPAALLASMNFFLSTHFDAVPAYPEYYPPFRYRLRVMLDHPFRDDWGKRALEDLLKLLGSEPTLGGVARSFKQYWDMLQSEAAKTTDVAAIDSDVCSKIAYSQVNPLLDSAWDYVKSRIGTSGLPWIVSYKEVPSCLRDLQAFVPCGELRGSGAEVGPPTSISAIALAAWLNQLHEHTAMIASASDAVKKYIRACRLFLKSLEDSQLKRVFAKSAVADC